MGYFDSVTNSAFKTTSDGTRLFFPWGGLGHGYVIPSEEEYQRLERNYRNMAIISILVALLGIISLDSFLLAVIIVVVLIGVYALWAWLQCRTLVPSAEKLTDNGTIVGQSRTYSTTVLWLLEILSLAFVVGGLLMLLLDPQNWLIAAAIIVFFGVGAFIFARMIRAKKRSQS